KALALMRHAVWDEGLLKELSQTMVDASICGPGQAAANQVLSVLKFFPETGKQGSGGCRTFDPSCGRGRGADRVHAERPRRHRPPRREPDRGGVAVRCRGDAALLQAGD